NAALSTTINSFGEKIFRKYRTLLLRGDSKPYYENEPEVKGSLSTTIRDKVLISKALASLYNGTWQHEPWPQDLSLPKVIGVYQPNDGVEKQCLEDIRRLCEQGIFPTST